MGPRPLWIRFCENFGVDKSIDTGEYATNSRPRSLMQHRTFELHKPLYLVLLDIIALTFVIFWLFKFPTVSRK